MATRELEGFLPALRGGPLPLPAAAGGFQRWKRSVSPASGIAAGRCLPTLLATQRVGFGVSLRVGAESAEEGLGRPPSLQRPWALHLSLP